MAIIPKILIVFNIIFLCCTVYASEITKCDCDIYQIYYSKDEHIYRNFTKQSLETNGQPIYYSYKTKGCQDMIWWNDEKKSWMGHQG